MNTALSRREKRRMWLMMMAIIAAELTSTFEVGMLYSALSKLYGTFGDPIGVGWLVTAFLLVGAASTALCGRLGDMLGRRCVLLALLFLAGAGSLISALSSTLPWIIFGRALQGVSAAILPLCIGLVREYIPKDRVPFGVGVISATASVGAGLGLVVGGLIADHLTWPWIFYCSATMAVVSAILIIVFLPRSAGAGFDRNVDILGGVLFAPAVAGILFAITKGASWGWLDARTLGLIGGCIVVLILWTLHELRHANPLIDVRLFANPQIALTNIAMALFALGTAQLLQVMLLLLQQPTWTQAGFGVSATAAALVKFPGLLLAVVAAPWSGSIAAKRGARQAMMYGTSMVALSWILMTLFHGVIGIVVVVMFAITFGGSMMYSAMPNLLVESVPEDRTSEAVGLLHVTRTTFTAIGAQILAFTLASSTVTDPARGTGVYPSSSAYLLTFVLITTACLLMVAVTLCLPGRKRAPAFAAAAGEKAVP